MPQAASKRQYRMMMAILHGDGPQNDRQPPKDVASKYSKPDKGAPESKDKDRGGKWRNKDKKNKKDDTKKTDSVNKSAEQFYRGQGAGVVVVNDNGSILVGKHKESGNCSLPGGHVDPGETFEDAARRELREETGIVAGVMHEVSAFKHAGNDCKVFYTDDYEGEPKDTKELEDVGFVEPHLLADDENMRMSSAISLKEFLNSHFKKNSVKNMLASERLEKNVMRGNPKSDIVLDVSHGDALRLVGNGCFRFLKRAVAGMEDEDFKEVKLDNHTISIRRHMSDVYSGRVSDGHKVIHQFTNKSLPELCADIMSIFEWYSDEDEDLFDILDEENLPDEEIYGGLSQLAENYTKHNLANIYTEMENIREEIRHGVAVDVQQVEDRMTKLFDRLEEATHKVVEQHNKLAQDAGDEIEELENKLRSLAARIDEIDKKPEKVEAYQPKHVDPDTLYNSQYMYLPKPEIQIERNGKIKIAFSEDWTDMEKSNFLNDMKAKIIKRD